MAGIVIDPEFRDLFKAQPLTAEQKAGLEAKIKAEGFREPLVVWDQENILLDGHHRLEICDRLGIPYKTERLTFESRAEALDWARKNQRFRRNHMPGLEAYEQGMEYEAKKKPSHRPATKGGHRDHLLEGRTGDAIGASEGVSPKTVRRNAAFAKAVDTIAVNVGADVKADILDGKSGLTKKDVVEVAKAPPEEQAAEIERRKAAPVRKARKDASEETMQDKEREKNKGETAMVASQELRATCKALKLMRAELRRVSKGLGCGWFTVMKRVNKGLVHAEQTIAKGMPHSICESCKGDGCEKCATTGWFPKEGEKK